MSPVVVLFCLVHTKPYSEFTPSSIFSYHSTMFVRPPVVLGIEPELIACNASDLPSILSLQLLLKILICFLKIKLLRHTTNRGT